MTKNVEFLILKKQIQIELVFREKLITYLKNILCFDLNKNINHANQLKN